MNCVHGSAGMPLDTGTVGAGAVVAVLSTVLFMCRRTLEGFDFVATAVEMKTVEIVEAVGDEGIRVLPFISVALMAAFLLCLWRLGSRMSMRWEAGPKQKMLESGENPEGNVEQ